MPPVDDAAMARWRELARQVELLAAKCLENPEAAALEGIIADIPVGGVTGFVGRRGGVVAPTNMKAAWLRACARKLIPERYKWDVTELMGGHAALTIAGVEYLNNPGDQTPAPRGDTPWSMLPIR